jgi:hypothetical protein
MCRASGAGSTRRAFLQVLAGAAGAVASGRFVRGDELSDLTVRPRHDGPRPRIGAVFTEFRELSHAYHILEAHMGPYLFNGRLTDPGVDVVSFYADQFPANDMAREVAGRLNVPLFDTIAGALTLGGDGLAVDGVLLIGEHGDYPSTPLGQKMYPRKEFFDQIVTVLERAGRTVPVFNDKHLSYRWDWAWETYDTARAKGIPLLAGSSVPLAARIPDTDVPAGSELVEAVSIHGGPLESYDFHGLEVLQSVVESRQGGETGMAGIQWLDREGLLRAADSGQWSVELAEAAMRAEFGSGFTGFAAEGPSALRHGLLVEYADGLRGVVLAVGQSGERWNFACRVRGASEPIAWRFYPGPWGNRNLFRALSHAIQHLFITRTAPYPVERTLLVTGALAAAMESYGRQGARVETPHLQIAYPAKDFTAMRERGDSWKILQPDTPRPPRFERGDLKTLQGLPEAVRRRLNSARRTSRDSGSAAGPG